MYGELTTRILEVERNTDMQKEKRRLINLVLKLRKFYRVNLYFGDMLLGTHSAPKTTEAKIRDSH